MPMPSTRSLRLASALVAAACAALLVACSGGGGGGGGGGGSAPTGSGAAATTTSVTLAWIDANGPVAGYSVYVQRDDGVFKHEIDVTASSVTLHGEPGSTARVTVAAFDAGRAYGPSSPVSPPFTFPNVDVTTDASAQGDGSGSGGDTIGGSGGTPDPGGDPAPTPASDPSKDPASALPGTLVWQAGDAFRLTDSETAPVTTRLFARPEEGVQLAGAADFDADGHDDLLWVRATAQLGYTSGSVLRSSSDPAPLVDLGALAADDRVLGAGDFDGDGDGDVLVANGDAVRARLTAPGAAPAVTELGTASGAVLAGIADFDVNGSEDVAWRASTGAIVIWLMNGGSLSATVEVALPSGLQSLGTGDFDGDGAAEVALRDSSGAVYLVHPLVAQSQLEPTPISNAQSWQPLGVADVDGDGSEELALTIGGAARIAGLHGDHAIGVEADSPWQLVALLP